MPSLSQERRDRAREIAKEKNAEAQKAVQPQVQPQAAVRATPFSEKAKATVKPTPSPREVISDANRALFEGIKRKRLEKKEKERAADEKKALDLGAQKKELEAQKRELDAQKKELSERERKKSSKRRKSVFEEEDDDDAEKRLDVADSDSVWKNIGWSRIMAIVCLVTGILGCLYVLCVSIRTTASNKKRY